MSRNAKAWKCKRASGYKEKNLSRYTLKKATFLDGLVGDKTEPQKDR